MLLVQVYYMFVIFFLIFNVDIEVLENVICKQIFTSSSIVCTYCVITSK